LSLEPDIEVLGTVADGEAAVREAYRLHPDILVSDIEMPGLTGLEVAERVRRFEVPCKVVILTTFARPGYLRRALDAGVAGYMIKDGPAEQLAWALRTVHGGGRVIDSQLAVGAWTEADPLSDRDRQLLRTAATGASAAEMAAKLGLSAGTVRNYLSEAMGKLGASSRIEAIQIAREKGWL
jgi:two-component system response regulator DesR